MCTTTSSARTRNEPLVPAWAVLTADSIWHIWHLPSLRSHLLVHPINTTQPLFYLILSIRHFFPKYFYGEWISTNATFLQPKHSPNFNRWIETVIDTIELRTIILQSTWWLVFTCRQSFPALNSCQHSVHPLQRSAASPTAYERPFVWRHPAACSRSEWAAPCPCCPPFLIDLRLCPTLFNTKRYAFTKDTAPHTHSIYCCRYFSFPLVCEYD